MNRLSLDCFHCFHCDAVPERNPAPDTLRRWTWVGVVPSRIAIDLFPRNHVVVGGRAFPWTGRESVAGPKVLLVHVSKREVLIALNDNCLRALREDHVVPGCAIALGD